MPQQVRRAYTALRSPLEPKAESDGNTAPFPLVRYLCETALQDSKFQARVAARVNSLHALAQNNPDLSNVPVLSHTADNAVDFLERSPRQSPFRRRCKLPLY